jgi:hypothetical protein
MDRPRRSIKPKTKGPTVPAPSWPRQKKPAVSSANHIARKKYKQAWRTEGTPIHGSVRLEDVQLGRGPRIQQHEVIVVKQPWKTSYS